MTRLNKPGYPEVVSSSLTVPIPFVALLSALAFRVGAFCFAGFAFLFGVRAEV
jgi:hypothetical protein